MKPERALSIGLLLSAVAFAASAGQQDRPATGSAAYEAEREPASEQAVAVQDTDRSCLRSTGTRIVRKERDACVIGTGRSYHRRDIDSTGAIDAVRALEMLDPAVRGR
jgi:hypothetical protein